MDHDIKLYLTGQNFSDYNPSLQHFACSIDIHFGYGEWVLLMTENGIHHLAKFRSGTERLPKFLEIL